MSAVARWADLLTAAGLGAIVNLPWELAHSLLYRDPPRFTWEQHLLCCSLAALADGIGIGAIYVAGAMAFRDLRWTRVRSSGRLAFAALLGLAGALITEGLALRLDWWAYGPAMPRVPGTNLGVSPLVQFVVLPPTVLFGLLPALWARTADPQCRRDQPVSRG